MAIYIPTIFFITAFAYFLLVWGYNIRHHLVIFMASLMCMGLAIYSAVNGVQDWNNFVTVFYSAVNFAIGAYFMIGSAMDVMKEGL